MNWHSEGPGSLFDAELGGIPLDAQQLRQGMHADDTHRVWVTVNVTGYQSGEDIELVENGELLRRGEVRIRLERAQDG